jgi:hypothetical protein
MIKSYLLALVLLPLFCCSQGFVPGYVLLTNGDTIHGFLKHPFGSPYGFRFTDGQPAKKEFPKKEVKGFYMEGDGLFHKIVFGKDSMEHMVRVFEEGYLNYYEFQWGSTISSYYHILEKKDSHEQFWYDSDLITGFKKGILRFLNDDPELCEKISTGRYGKKEIMQIVREYNLFHAQAR